VRRRAQSEGHIGLPWIHYCVEPANQSSKNLEGIIPTYTSQNKESESGPELTYLAQREDKVIFLGLVSYTVQITHWDVDGASVYPPTMWMKGNPVWQKPGRAEIQFGEFTCVTKAPRYSPELRRNGVVSIPIVNVQNRQPEFSPGGDRSGTTYRSDSA
jgi:hypothetical protein